VPHAALRCSQGSAQAQSAFAVRLAALLPTRQTCAMRAEAEGKVLREAVVHLSAEEARDLMLALWFWAETGTAQPGWHTRIMDGGRALTVSIEGDAQPGPFVKHFIKPA
jgi:hypothetical protein